MSTIYKPNDAGPWLCVDDQVTCNGYLANGTHVASTLNPRSGPTCNGVRPSGASSSGGSAGKWGAAQRRTLRNKGLR